MSDTLKSILLAFAVIVGFALLFALLMPGATGAWKDFAYFGGVLTLWAIVSALIAIGNKVADSRARKRGTLPLLVLGALGLGAMSCQRTPTPAREQQAIAEYPTHTYTDSSGYDVTVVDTVKRGW